MGKKHPLSMTLTIFYRFFYCTSRISVYVYGISTTGCFCCKARVMAKALLKGKGGISINVLQREYIMYTSKKPSKTCMVACSTHSSLKSATMG